MTSNLPPAKSTEFRFEVVTIPCLTDNFCYLIRDRQHDVGVLVDASEIKPLQNALDTIELKAVLMTHHDHDHIEALADLPRVPLYCSERDLTRIPSAGSGPKRALFDGAHLSWRDLTGLDGPLDVKVLHTPGHSEGHLCFFFTWDNEMHLFTGDTLFSYGCGRCREGTPVELFESLQKLKKLPGRTRVHFGHDYREKNLEFFVHLQDELLSDGLSVPRSTVPRDGIKFQKESVNAAPFLQDEISANPFLQINDVDLFTKWRKLRSAPFEPKTPLKKY